MFTFTTFCVLIIYMKHIRLQDNLYWQLLRTAINAKHGLMKIADTHGLTVMQLYTLCLLEDDISIPMNSLSCMLNCDASNITGIVDRLFAQDYISREENPKDRRVKMITLTPKGSALCEKIFQELPAHQPPGLVSLSTDEQNQLRDLLIRILQQPAAN